MKKKYIIYGTLLILIVIQFFRIDKSVPEFDPSGDIMIVTNSGEQVAGIIKNACYDCHSFETEYPWYANVAPVSWWVKDHVNEGRGHLNFSTWVTYPPKRADHKLEEVEEMIENREMPLKSFLVTHSEARITDEEREKIIDWANKLRKEIGLVQ